MIRPAQSVTLFDGPPSGGKTWTALRYAAQTGAKYVELGTLPGIKGAQLGRIYVEAMLPALLGYQAVVLDGSWVGEEAYAAAYRGGASRLLRAHHRMLARLALRAGARIVYCLPGLDVCRAELAKRKIRARSITDAQLQIMHAWYTQTIDEGHGDLDAVAHDFTRGDEASWLHRAIPENRKPPHPDATVLSAGNYHARVAIVGDTFGSVKDGDPLYQWPFASFSNQGCSRWLTEQLESYGIEEAQLLWVNRDQLDSCGESTAFNDHLRQRHVIAFGHEAARRLAELAIDHKQIAHPQAWSRLQYQDTYRPFDLIAGLLAQPKETRRA